MKAARTLIGGADELAEGFDDKAQFAQRVGGAGDRAGRVEHGVAAVGEVGDGAVGAPQAIGVLGSAAPCAVRAEITVR